MAINTNSFGGLTNTSYALDYKNNTATLTQIFKITLAPTFDYNTEYTTDIPMRIDNEAVNPGVVGATPRLGDIYVGKPSDYYPNVPFRCVNKTIDLEYDNEVRIWKITCTYLAEGISYWRVNTESVRLIAFSYSPENYDFAVRYAYKNQSVWAGGDDTDDSQDNPTKVIQNSIQDPLLEGLTQVRSMTVMKFTMEYDSDSAPALAELDKVYNNSINMNQITVLGRTIEMWCGLLSIDSVDIYHPLSGAMYVRISYTLKIKDSIDVYDNWISRVINQGYYFKSTSKAPLGKRKIMDSDVNPAITSTKDSEVTNPIPLTKAGGILTDASSPYWLYFQVQPMVDWTPLAFPEYI